MISMRDDAIRLLALVLMFIVGMFLLGLLAYLMIPDARAADALTINRKLMWSLDDSIGADGQPTHPWNGPCCTPPPDGEKWLGWYVGGIPLNALILDMRGVVAGPTPPTKRFYTYGHRYFKVYWWPQADRDPQEVWQARICYDPALTLCDPWVNETVYCAADGDPRAVPGPCPYLVYPTAAKP